MKLKLEVIFEVPVWSLDRNTKIYDAIENVLKEDKDLQESYYHIQKLLVNDISDT